MVFEEIRRLRFPRIGLPRCLGARSVHGSVIVSARGRRRALLHGEKQDSDGNYSSSYVCCKRLAKIPAKKRINVTGGKREKTRERERVACLFSCRITVAEIITRCSLSSVEECSKSLLLAIRVESPR